MFLSHECSVSAIVRPIYVHVNSMNTAASKHTPLGSEAVDRKAVNSNPLSSSRQEDAKGSFQNNLTSDQMYSMLQLESDDSDSASVITCTKEKSRNSKKQKKLTILDAIVGLKLTRTKSFNGSSSSSSSSNKNKDRCSSHCEKAYLQRRNAALEEYMGPSSQVVPINKDHKKTIFKDNTRLLQTIQVLHRTALYCSELHCMYLMSVMKPQRLQTAFIIVYICH
jgi:hypothetical protein